MDPKSRIFFICLLSLCFVGACISPVTESTYQERPPTPSGTLNSPTQDFLADATPFITLDPDATPVSRSSVYLLPVTGFVIKGSELSGGSGELSIDNMDGVSDAIAVFTNAGQKDPLIAVYIQKKTKYTLQNIHDGNFDLYIYHGDKWNRSTKKFEENSFYSKFEDTFPYQTTASNYTTWSVTLYKVIDGNAKEEMLSEERFPEI